MELLEWIGMLALRSPRIQPGSSVDPFLCRYVVPGHDEASVRQLVCLKWRGFMPAEFVRNLLVYCLYVCGRIAIFRVLC